MIEMIVYEVKFNTKSKLQTGTTTAYHQKNVLAHNCESAIETLKGNFPYNEELYELEIEEVKRLLTIDYCFWTE